MRLDKPGGSPIARRVCSPNGWGGRPRIMGLSASSQEYDELTVLVLRANGRIPILRPRCDPERDYDKRWRHVCREDTGPPRRSRS